MGDGKKKARPLPGMPGANTAQTRPAFECPDGYRCHINGKGLTMFGTKHRQAMVDLCARSSVLLVGDGKPFASGTLIALERAPERSPHKMVGIVLCASHSINSGTVSKIEVTLFNTFNAKTAPGGRFDGTTDKTAWTTGTPGASSPHGVVVKTLESDSDLDYALMMVSWNAGIIKVDDDSSEWANRTLHFQPPGGTFHYPVIGASPVKGDKVLLVGHPDEFGKGAEVTQATSGTVLDVGVTHPTGGQGSEFVLMSTGGAFGMSGGAVFNQSGEFFGVFIGVKGGMRCLDVHAAVAKKPSARLAEFVKQTGQMISRDADFP